MGFNDLLLEKILFITYLTSSYYIMVYKISSDGYLIAVVRGVHSPWQSNSLQNVFLFNFIATF